LLDDEEIFPSLERHGGVDGCRLFRRGRVFDLEPGVEKSLLIKMFTPGGAPAFGARLTPGFGLTVPERHFRASKRSTHPVSETAFVRGEVNLDGRVDVSDAVRVFNHLFLDGGEPSCLATADLDSNRSIEITDGLYLLRFPFNSGPPPAFSYPASGRSAAVRPEDCVEFALCP